MPTSDTYALIAAVKKLKEQEIKLTNLQSENANLKTQQWYLRWLEASNMVATLRAEMEGMLRKE